MTLTINDLLQTIKHRLNRHTAFPLTAAKVQQLNAVIDRFVNGGRVVEDEELDTFLNPPLLLEATDSAEASVVVEDLNQEVDAVYDAAVELAADALTPEITAPSPEVESALQAIVDDAQEMGLYDMKYDVPPAPSIATPLTMDELVAVAELQKELGMTNEEVQSEIDSGDLIPVAGSDIDFVTPSATATTGDTAVAEVTELPESTNEAQG